MKFIDRTSELKLLKKAKELSNKKLYSIVIYGLRRVGKTRLVLEFTEPNDIYFFVNKDKTSNSLLEEYENQLKIKGIITKLEKLNNWNDFFSIIFERFNGTVVFDEFQNFSSVAPEVYGILQEKIDTYEHKKGLLLIFLGSLIGVIKKTFEDNKLPLYGRVKRKLFLKPLSFKHSIQFYDLLKISAFDDWIRLYSVFGGFPKYYVAIEDEQLIGKDFYIIMDEFFFEENALFENEVHSILSLEFGKRTGIYYDILSAIANGNTSPSKISGYVNRKVTSITRHLNELINRYNIIEKEQPFFGGRAILKISHPLMKFWFTYFYKNLSLYLKHDKLFIRDVKKDLERYVGKGFEDVCREYLYEKGYIVGRQWGKFKGEKGKNTYEIDIVAVKDKIIKFGECKWSDNVDGNIIINQLKKKVAYIQSSKLSDYKIKYILFAKSFKIRPKNVECVDLKQMENFF
ncbi:ATP-binding protein, partial [Candidatus Micrarchaeota archaeon]|nr:ATP-binding protein [Candidatus Micrarchaeota archaeon]